MILFIVETARGVEFGEVVVPVRELSTPQLSAPLKQVVRIATEQDVEHARENKAAEKGSLRDLPAEDQ